MLADQESIEASSAQANLIDQLEGSFGAHGQSLQVAIVHSQDAGVRSERAVEFSPGVNFHERLHAKLAAERDEFMELRISKRGDDQEKTVGVVSTRFPNLPRIEYEVLAKNGESDGLAGFAKI